jgi:hypothetical protein
MRQASEELQLAAGLAARLRARREEIEQAISARVLALSQPPEANSLEYAEGLRAAVAAGIEYGIVAVGQGGAAVSPVPAAMLEQARLAARSGVGLDTVLRRYLAGHALLGDFVVEEAEGQIPAKELKRLLRRLAAAVDRILTEVTAAYNEEVGARRRGADKRRSDLVERLLAGELLDTQELGYELDLNHLGLVTMGLRTGNFLRKLANLLDARLLSVQSEHEVAWAWLGRREALDLETVRRLAEANRPLHAPLALGEPAEGPSGWRLTHHQARAAFPIAQRSNRRLIRYADVALLASVIQDDLAVTSLRRLFLKPLEGERDGGATLRETLQAYFAADRNMSSAAAVLCVSRNTVASRLREVEVRLGRPLHACGAEMEAALRLNEVSELTAVDPHTVHVAEGEVLS